MVGKGYSGLQPEPNWEQAVDYRAEQVVSQLEVLAVTHVVWLPDSAMGPWERAFD